MGMDRETAMQHWDTWREYIANGGKGSMPRDGFESYLDRIAELEAALEKLFEHASAYQSIDNVIHSRKSDVPWSEVEKDAEIYTWARKDLILTLREVEQALKGEE